jgi:hypothetical protein
VLAADADVYWLCLVLLSIESQPERERSQAVDELVQMEDDRLALLEHRLLRMKQRLTKQRNELVQFIEALTPHDKPQGGR